MPPFYATDPCGSLRCHNIRGCSVKKLDESLLTNLPPFHSLTRSQIREILDAAQTARYDTGQTVFAEDMPSAEYWAMSGKSLPSK